ncbi:MAG: hypothetical protein M1815_004617 [Lichina confinis]|nr:MAG: hypothetical protein M1815_004617 [Lichina confinis]
MATPSPSPTLPPAQRPGLPPPPGVTSNFVDPPGDGTSIIIVCAIELVLTTVILLLRMYTRIFVNRRVWWDDYTMILAWIGLFAFAGLIFGMVKFGGGKDAWNVTFADAARHQLLVSHSQIVARIAMTLAKFSVLLMFLRIFRPPPVRKDKMFYAIWFVIWLNLLYCVALVMTVLLECVGQTRTPGKACINIFALVTSAASINVATDILMLAIPIVAVWNLHMTVKRKIGLSFVFAVGSLAVAVSLARLGYQVRFFKTRNPTREHPKAALMALSEQAVVMIVGGMPVLPALFRHLYHSKDRSRTTGSGSESRKTGSSFPSRQTPRPTTGDDYLLSRDYKELDDLEHQHKRRTDIQTTAPGTDAGYSDASLSSLTGDGVVVSRSVQIESHPRPDGDHTTPPALVHA